MTHVLLWRLCHDVVPALLTVGFIAAALSGLSLLARLLHAMAYLVLCTA